MYFCLLVIDHDVFSSDLSLMFVGSLPKINHN